jgi:hypothetical protein
LMKTLEEEIKTVNKYLKNLTEYTIAWWPPGGAGGGLLSTPKKPLRHFEC